MDPYHVSVVTDHQGQFPREPGPIRAECQHSVDPSFGIGVVVHERKVIHSVTNVVIRDPMPAGAPDDPPIGIHHSVDDQGAVIERKAFQPPRRRENTSMTKAT